MASAPPTLCSPSLTFRLLTSILSSTSSPETSTLLTGPRLGTLTLSRSTDSQPIRVSTPGFMTTTSRGTVPHLSRDNVRKTPGIDWVHVPYETFLEHNPPVPSLQPGPNPLHRFLGFSPCKHIVSMSLRDPSDGRELPANTKDTISAMTVRGVKKVTPVMYNTHVAAVQPDVVFALGDTPFTPPPHSEKRVIKSLERSLSWLAAILRLTPPTTSSEQQLPSPNVFVHMAGGISDVSRDDFATGLLEPLDGADAKALNPLGITKLDDGITGYAFDLVPLIASLKASSQSTTPNMYDEIVSLIRTSLLPLPTHKPRLATAVASPHQMLRLIESGVDIFDSNMAQKAADWGVALDFRFPAPSEGKDSGKVDIGPNIYDEVYSMDFSRLSQNYLGAMEATNQDAETASTCPCIACSPIFSSNSILHSTLDSSPTEDNLAPPITRAYIHHLLHTHEMSAHSFLASHNISVLGQFFGDIRRFIENCPPEEVESTFRREVERFEAVYARPEGEGGVMERAKKRWELVELARGKGRLAREKASQEAGVNNETGAVLDRDVVTRAMEGAASGSGKFGDVDLVENVADEVLGG